VKGQLKLVSIVGLPKTEFTTKSPDPASKKLKSPAGPYEADFPIHFVHTNSLMVLINLTSLNFLPDLLEPLARPDQRCAS